jgi:Holliday junction resolvasome RuvABC endonuclease subunit
MAKRLMGIRNKTNELINKFNVEKVILEDIQLQNNVTSNVVTYKALAEVIGVITELCAELKLPYELIHSTSWKSNLNIKGKTRPE